MKTLNDAINQGLLDYKALPVIHKSEQSAVNARVSEYIWEIVQEHMGLPPRELILNIVSRLKETDDVPSQFIHRLRLVNKILMFSLTQEIDDFRAIEVLETVTK